MSFVLKMKTQTAVLENIPQQTSAANRKQHTIPLFSKGKCQPVKSKYRL